MFYAVTHFDGVGQRRKARVLASGWADALEQMERVFGVATRASCLRLSLRPVVCGDGFYRVGQEKRSLS